ncbi:MAG: sterol desaturase family protein [Pseudobdellovibrionaceae bacterium]
MIKRSLRLFENPLLEMLSKVHPWIPILVWGSVFLALQVGLFQDERISGIEQVAFVALGVFYWIFLEYILHRYVFHMKLSSESFKRFGFIIHGVHHEDPKDRFRGLMPPLATFICAIPLYFLCALAYSGGKENAVFSGLLLGFVTYDYVHFSFHQAQFKNRIWKELQKRHLIHHRDETANYGVSSPLVDIICRTGREK